MKTGIEMPPQMRVYAAFFLYSLALGGLYPRLGDIQLAMGIEEGALGLALTGIAIGTQISLIFAGPVIDRLGYRNILIVGIFLIALLMATISLASSPWAMFFLLIGAGMAAGAVEIVINVEADRTEHLIGRRVMNRAHAFWSLGFFGAGITGALMKAAAIGPALHLFVIAGLIIAPVIVVLRDFKPAPTRNAEEGSRPRFVLPTGPILILVLFTLSAMLLEGAVIDWSVIYMRDIFMETPFINSLAFAIGALAQSLMRFFADGFIDRFGPVRVARLLLSTLGVGTLAVVFAPHPAVALLGFALIGTGASAIFPLAMSAAAQRTDRPSSANVAALAQLSFMTFLLAPPLLGFVAEHVSLRHAFGIGLPLIVLSFLTLSALKPRAIVAGQGKDNG